VGAELNAGHRVTYSDNLGIDPATFDNLDVFVTGPRGFTRNANFDHADATTTGTPRTATYIVKGPAGSWDSTDNGVYTITLRRRQVRDTTGNPAAATVLGAFSAKIHAPAAVVTATPLPTGAKASKRLDDPPVFA